MLYSFGLLERESAKVTIYYYILYITIYGYIYINKDLSKTRMWKITFVTLKHGGSRGLWSSRDRVDFTTHTGRKEKHEK